MPAQPSNSSLTPRPIQPEDAASLHALLRAGLPDVEPDPGSWLARWNWQYRDNPFREDRPAGWVLSDGQRVVGHLGAVYVPVRAGGRVATGAIGADYVVSPEALKAGGMFAGLQLAQAFFDGTAGCLRMATTANESTGAVFGRFGCKSVEWTREFWRASTSLRQQIRTCRGGASRVVRRLMSGLPGTVGSTILTAVYGLCRHMPALPIPQGCRLDVGMPDLVLEAACLWQPLSKPLPAGTGFAIDRTSAYLKWRYLHHPQAGSIRSLLVRRATGEVIGAAVVFIEQQASRRVAFLEELVIPASRDDAMHTLICASLRLAADHAADHLVCTAGTVDGRDRFWEFGFESRARSAPALVVGNLPGDPADPALESSVLAACFQHGEMF